MGPLLNRTSVAKASMTVVMVLLGLLMVVPFLLMLSASFKFSADAFNNPLQLIPEKINWNNYNEIFKHKYYFTWFLNSALVVVGILILKTLVVSMAAYAFSKLRFKGRDILFVVLMSAMMVTSDTTIVARYFQYSAMGLINTLWVLIIPSLFGVYFLFLLRQFFLGIPMELSEAAIMDGSSHVGIYFRIILPLAKPALLTMALFSFIWSWNDFINPFVFITPMATQVLVVGLQSFQTEYAVDTSLQMAGICLSLIPVLMVFILVQKHFVEGIASTGIKG